MRLIAIQLLFIIFIFQVFLFGDETASLPEDAIALVKSFELPDPDIDNYQPTYVDNEKDFVYVFDYSSFNIMVYQFKNYRGKLFKSNMIADDIKYHRNNYIYDMDVSGDTAIVAGDNYIYIRNSSKEYKIKNIYNIGSLDLKNSLIYSVNDYNPVSDPSALVNVFNLNFELISNIGTSKSDDSEDFRNLVYQINVYEDAVYLSDLRSNEYVKADSIETSRYVIKNEYIENVSEEKPIGNKHRSIFVNIFKTDSSVFLLHNATDKIMIFKINSGQLEQIYTVAKDSTCDGIERSFTVIGNDVILIASRTYGRKVEYYRMPGKR